LGATIIDASSLVFAVASIVLVGDAVLATLGLGFAALTFAVRAPVGVFAGRLSAWRRSRAAGCRAR
jgi:hypothetical protein